MQNKKIQTEKNELFTGGEWKFDGIECIVTEKGEVIADIRPCNHDGEEVENQVFNRSADEARSNAELIAASPALLTALEWLLDAIPSQDNDHDWWPDELTTAVANAKAILNK